jgi:hypothetical protein
MANGSPIVPIRIPPLFLAMIDKSIASANRTRKLEPYNRSSWILNCIQDRLEKLDRSKGRKRKKRNERQVTRQG